jgi:hypothetical protein
VLTFDIDAAPTPSSANRWRQPQIERQPQVEICVFSPAMTRPAKGQHQMVQTRALRCIPRESLRERVRELGRLSEEAKVASRQLDHVSSEPVRQSHGCAMGRIST